MRKLLGLTVLALALASTALPAEAGIVCVNSFCGFVPGVHGRVTVSMDPFVKADGGLDGGPGIAPTGFHDLQAKPDSIRTQLLINGQEQGWVGITQDYGQMETRFWLGRNGCYLLDFDGFRSCQFDDD